MSNFPLLIAAINFCLFWFSKTSDWLFQAEPTVKMLTTYGTFLVFLVTVSVQGYRWYKRWRKKPRAKN